MFFLNFICCIAVNKRINDELNLRNLASPINYHVFNKFVTQIEFLVNKMLWEVHFSLPKHPWGNE